MSQPDQIGTYAAITPGADSGAVRGAIARAAQATGADFNFLLAQARLESSLDPNAHAASSSAAGLYQFTDATWRSALDRHGAAYGLRGADAGAMALRYDPQAAALMAGEMAGDNAAALAPVLGRAPDAAELYLAHFLGADGATRFLTALGTDPAQSAAALLPKAAAANRAVFYGADGAARSVGAVMTLLRTKVQAAMQDGGAAPLAPTAQRAPASGPLAQQFAAAQAQAGPASSMADTLRNAFGLGGDGAAPASAQFPAQVAGPVPAHVRAAYGRLLALGL